VAHAQKNDGAIIVKVKMKETAFCSLNLCRKFEF